MKIIIEIVIEYINTHTDIMYIHSEETINRDYIESLYTFDDRILLSQIVGVLTREEKLSGYSRIYRQTRVKDNI